MPDVEKMEAQLDALELALGKEKGEEEGPEEVVPPADNPLLKKKNGWGKIKMARVRWCWC